MLRRAQVTMLPSALEMLIESLGADVSRLFTEIEKLSLYGQTGRPINEDDIASLIPDARETTIFALVNALGRKDRTKALGILDTLCRDGEYLPLALSFLSGQFRTALIAKEANLRTSQQIQGHFSKLGIPMWGSRAEQVAQTMGKFTKEQLERGLKLIFEADRALRSPRPDDRIVMESFVAALTA
jgi:DNA polymerase III subunit delta